MISPVNYLSFNNRSVNTSGNIRPSYRVTQLNQDTVCFTGALKVLTNACDKAFVNILTKELNLDAQKAAKLKDTVWNFLREHKVQSLGELGGEDNFDVQWRLHERIAKAISLPEDKGEYLGMEIVNCCDEGKDYIPRGLEGFRRNMDLEDLLTGKVRTVDGLKNVFSNQEDDSFYRFAKKLLRQSPDESYEFRTTVEEYLKENNLKSITELFLDEDLICEQAGLIERLENKFNLSESESTALNWEFLERANTNVMDRDYKPDMSPHIKDLDSVVKIVDDGGYAQKEELKRFDTELFRKMSKEAEEKNYENVFEIFKSENNPAKSETYKFIMESRLSQDQKANLIIDLTKISKDPEAFAGALPKQAGKDNYYANIQIDMMAERIAKTFGLEEKDSEFYDEIVLKKMKDLLRKMYPEHIDDGENTSIKQIAFEIADGYGLPSGAEKEIEKIVSDVEKGGTRMADIYMINKLTSELE